jgi:tRNA(fMet)-specific endonuclease VapC
MLDTNIISDLIRNPQGRAAKRIAKVGEDNICTSIVVAAELRY